MRFNPNQPASRRIPVEPAELAALQAFGQIIGHDNVSAPVSADFYAAAVTTSRPVDFRSAGPVELSLASVTPRPGRVHYMERHFLHTQTFIPLRGKPFVLVMAPPGDRDLPDLDLVRAFYFDGSAGFLMHIGTWHEFPFALQADTDLVVILSAQTTLDLKNRSEDGSEASGPDLQKLDIAARTGVVLEFDLPHT